MARVMIDGDRLHRELEKIVGDKRVSMRAGDLTTYSRDMWPRLLFAVRAGDPVGPAPHAVVWPESVREVAAVVKLARTLRLPIIPYGGGSGVCGGTVPVLGGITLDLKRMDNLIGVDPDEMVCDVESGLNGERFERDLNRRGFTLGHFPSSIYCSTVGGWVATRAAGQMSTKYGKIEDRVAGVTVVTGRGDIVQTDHLARATSGPHWTQLLVGSEGTLGVITSARLRVSMAPELRTLRGFEFAGVPQAVEAIRRVMQRGLRPAVVRLYDELDTFVHARSRADQGDAESARPEHGAGLAPVPAPGSGALPDLTPRPGEQPGSDHFLARMIAGLSGRKGGGSLAAGALGAVLSRPRLLNGVAGLITHRVARKGCLLITGCVGSRIRTEVEARLTFSEFERAGGVDLGEEPGRRWFEHRYAVSYGMSKVFAAGAFVDTMEVASTWERLLDLYDAVRTAIGRHAFVMAHFSHAYPEGCSIYFTFAGHAEGRAGAERLYDAIWRDGLTAATRVGGTISHHHGVGLLKSRYMHAEHREAMAILRGVKRSFDPDGIMNPGKLGLPADPVAG